ncbi:MAG: hypothetical protein ACE5FJ_11340 [Gemmatimonadales bacterium]
MNPNPITHHLRIALVRSYGAYLTIVIVAACGSRSVATPSPTAQAESRCSAGGGDCPSLTISSPQPWSTFARGETVAFELFVASSHEIVAVTAAAAGAVRLRFPTIAPSDTTYRVSFPIPTADATGDTIVFRATATDEFGGQGVILRSVIVQ